MGDLRLGLDSDEILETLAQAGFEEPRILPVHDRVIATSKQNLRLFIATGSKPGRTKRKRRDS